MPGQEYELKRRLAMVQRRTLRRQAREFLDRPFTQRRCRLYEYAMSDAERLLYDDVTEYLLEPSLFAFAGRQRRLLLIGFHRRMASSISALAASLENVAARLRRLQQGLGVDDTVTNVLRDLEDEDDIEDRSEEPNPPIDRPALAAELARVKVSSAARSLPNDAKARYFQEAIKIIFDLARNGRGSGKAVVFTESITTQEYLLNCVTTASNENKIPVTASGRNSIASISASSTISMRSSARSALKLRDNRVKREQNPCHGHYNETAPRHRARRRGNYAIPWRQRSRAGAAGARAMERGGRRTVPTWNQAEP